MPDYDAGFKIVAHHAGRQLSAIARVPCDRWEPVESTLQTTERLADRAFKARADNEEFVVYFEAYTRWAEAAPWSVLAKSGLLSERERLPTVSLVYILLPDGYPGPQGRFRLQALGRPTQQVWFREVCLWRQKPQSWWEEHPALMALFPLCRHVLSVRDAITYPASVIQGRVSDPVVRANFLTTLGIFGTLVSPGIVPMEILGRQAMKESPFYQQIQAEARVADILQVLGIRFGTEKAAAFQEALQPLWDTERLAELHAVAVKCRRLADFRRALNALPSTL